MIREAVAPYLLWIKLGVLALVLGAGVRGGCVMQRGIDNAEITSLKADVKGRDGALLNAAGALRAAGTAIKAINAEAERRLDVAKRENEALAEAGKVAEAARERAERNAATLQAQIDRAKAKSPACTALMLSNVEAVCTAVPVR